MLQITVNALGVVTVALCAILLMRAFVRVRQPLLLWCGLCFVGLTAANTILLIDVVLFPEINFYRLRLGVAAGAMCLMVYGLVFRSEQS
jgi:hypothetical protein